MDFHSYLIYFQNILADPAPLPPYNNPDYLNYTRLNWLLKELKETEFDQLLDKAGELAQKNGLTEQKLNDLL